MKTILHYITLTILSINIVAASDLRIESLGGNAGFWPEDDQNIMMFPATINDFNLAQVQDASGSNPYDLIRSVFNNLILSPTELPSTVKSPWPPPNVIVVLKYSAISTAKSSYSFSEFVTNTDKPIAFSKLAETLLGNDCPWLYCMGRIYSESFCYVDLF